MVITEACRWTSSELLSLCSSRTKLDLDTRLLITRLGFSRRGCRAGRHIRSRSRRRVRSGCVRPIVNNDVTVCAIPVIISDRPTVYTDAHILYRGLRERCFTARRTIRRVCCSNKQSSDIRFGVFNAQSIGNKFASVSKWISDNKLLFAAVVETWHDSADSPDLIACTPADYCCLERARLRPDGNHLDTNYGGVSLFYQRSLHVRSVAISNYETFEYISAVVNGSGVKLLVIVIYRPGTKRVTNAFC